ncbi:MAG: histone deacetylase family protein [Dehalococcoidales bacterium]|nr:histone deacetylase family protein [Dehalococcoidales bacterium]
MVTKPAILYSEDLKQYDFGSGHPFRGDRYSNFIQLLKSRLSGDRYYGILSAEPATMDDLLRICDKDYIDFNREFFHAASGGWHSYFEDFSHYHSRDNQPIGIPGQLEEAARLIIGQAKKACDLVQSGKYLKAISVGGGMHHAKQRFGEGFCIYNDVAFAAFYLAEQYKLERILVIDTDAHAGNGTADYLRTNTKILFIDIHQDPHTIYPGTGFVGEIGEGKRAGLDINIPMPLGAGDESYRKIYDEIILPVTQEYQPEIIVRNGGSDPYFDDGLTNLAMTVAGFKMMGEKIREMTEVCGGKEIDLIASGYNEKVLPYVWLSLLSGVADFPLTIEEPETVPPQLYQDDTLTETEKVISEVKRNHLKHWRCFK